MPRLFVAAAIALSVVSSATQAQSLKTEDEKTLYALGLLVGGNLKSLTLKPAELAIVQRGISDAANSKKPQVELEKYGPLVQTFAQKRGTAAADKEKGAAKEFVAKATKEPGATALPSGLVYKSLKPGTGASPAATDKVKVNYEGKLTDGTIFDSSYKRGEPIEFALNGVIKCWTEGVQKMKVGETAQLVCPSDIAYGDRGHPPTIPGGATLVFKVELLSIMPAAAPASPPASPPMSTPKP